MLYGGPIVFDLSDAAEVMRWYRDFQASAPEDFYIWLGLQSVPPGDPFPKEHQGKKMCVLLIAHNGEGGEAAVNAIRSALPTPIIDWAGPIPYTTLQSMFDALYPAGMQWYWKGDFVKALPDAAIDAHIQNVAKASDFSRCISIPLTQPCIARAGRYRLELPRRYLVDGNRRDRSRSQQRPH